MKKLILITTLILLSIVSYSQTFVKHGDLIVRNNGVWVEHGESVTLVTSINVASLSEAVIIDTDGGSLDFEADVSPDTAADTTITWSYIAGTGTADFETEVGAPTLTALTNGTVTVRATANDGSGIYGEVEITISNQVAPDETAPTLSSIELGTYNDSILLAIWSENLQQDSIPPTSAFALTEDGNTFGIEAITINEDSLFIALDSTGAYGSTYLLSYTSGTPAVQDSSENNAVSFTGQAVTNNISAPGGETNLIYNGDFSEGETGWNAYSDGLSVTGGELVYDNTGSVNSVIDQAYGYYTELTASTDYTIAFDVVSLSPGLYIYIQNTSSEVFVAGTNYTTGSYSIDFTTQGTISNGIVRIRVWGDADGTIDNIILTAR